MRNRINLLVGNSKRSAKIKKEHTHTRNKRTKDKPCVSAVYGVYCYSCQTIFGCCYFAAHAI